MKCVLALVALGLACAGCNDHGKQALFREDFESACSGAPCGWTQIAGAPGSAIYLETIPSEHGVQLIGDGVAIARTVHASATSSPGGSAPIDAMLRAHVVARCDPHATITLIVTLDGGSRTIDVSGGTTFPPTWDGVRSVFVLDPVNATDVGQTFDGIVRVVLHKQGTGACEVDDIVLADAAFPFPQ